MEPIKYAEVEDTISTDRDSEPSSPTTVPLKRSIKGLLFGLAGELSFSLTTPMLKYLFMQYPNLSPFSIIYWRSLTNVVLNYLYCIKEGSHVLDFP